MTERCPHCNRAYRRKKPLTPEERRKRLKAATMKALSKPMPKTTRYKA